VLINDRLGSYRQRYSGKDVQDLLAMVALQFVVRLLELERKSDSSMVEGQLRELTQTVDEFLNQI